MLAGRGVPNSQLPSFSLMSVPEIRVSNLIKEPKYVGKKDTLGAVFERKKT